MDFDEPEKNVATAIASPGQDLSAFSVDELREMIAVYKAEILRIETDIVKKQSTKSAAHALFGSSKKT